jgi:hypothetical protein
MAMQSISSSRYMLSNPNDVANEIGKKFEIGPTPLWAMQEELEQKAVLQPYTTILYPGNSLKDIFAYFKLEPTNEVTALVEYNNGRLIGYRAGEETVETSLKAVYQRQNTSAVIYDSSEKWLLSINESGGVALLTRAEG